MKEILVIRHGNWDLVNDTLTDEGRERCLCVKPRLGSFALAISSTFGRAQETAKLLSDLEPVVDERAGIAKSTPELRKQVAERRKTHPLGVVGAIISISELREPLRKQGEALKELIEEALSKLTDEQGALIVSHDGPIVAAEKVIKGEPFEDLDHTFGELGGFRIGEDMEIREL